MKGLSIAISWADLWGEGLGLAVETVNGVKELQGQKTLCLSLPGLEPKDQPGPGLWNSDGWVNEV